MPTGGDVKDFVLSKFDPVIESSPALRESVTKDPLSRRAIFSTVLKRIGGSHYFFRGSWSEHRAQTIDADILVVDELDFQKPEVRAMYEERLEGSGSKDVIYWVGTPTLPAFGISELYESSDQRNWNIKCPACGKLQVLEFPASISFKKKQYICIHCRENLSDEDRRKGIWIAKYPERKIHGYHFNRLMAPWVPARKIIDSYHKDSVKHFYNFSLGLSYVEESQRFKREEFQKAQINNQEFNEFKREKMICGLDQGNHFHMVVGYAGLEEAVATKVKRFDSTKELEEALDDMRPDLVVMDMFPDQHYAKILQERFGSNHFLMVNQRSWTNPQRAQSFMDFQRKEGIINLERTESLDRMFDRIRNSSLRFLNSMTGLQDLFQHLSNLIPDFQERFGRRKKVYKKVGQEDYAHATNYFITGCEILFPNSGHKPNRIVPSAQWKEPSSSSEKWLEEDFEKSMRGTSVHGSSIVIPPKHF